MPSSITSRARCCLTGDRLLAQTAAAVPERQVEIAFAGAAGTRTFLRRQRVAYPFHVGRALYLPGDPAEFCTVYLQSCSGGLFQKDRLGIALTGASGARAHVTTSASTVTRSKYVYMQKIRQITSCRILVR